MLATALPHAHFYALGLLTGFVCVWWLVMRKMF